MNQHKLIEKACEICGRKFPARASDKRANRGRACSFRCSGRLGATAKKNLNKAKPRTPYAPL